jgi:uncharacterized protein YecE (DUF72 family)
MIRIGISGWSYANWRGDFYPKGLPGERMLAFAAERLATIEINATFYGPQPAERIRRWREAVPEGFVFAVKGPRQATHLQRLEAIEPIMAQFFAGSVNELKPKLGPILWQLPASLRFEPEPFARFLAALPRERRHAVEARHESFGTAPALDLLRRHGIALVLSHAQRWPSLEATTADFAYLRLHGPERLYASGYDAAQLDAWGERVVGWAEGGRDVFVYFNNTMAGRAPHDALALAERVTAQPA